MADLLIVRSQLCLVLLDSPGPDRRLQARFVIEDLGLVRPVVELGLEPLDLRGEALDLAPQLTRIGFTESRVERRQYVAFPHDVPHPGMEAAHRRGLERLHDDRRCRRHQLARRNHDPSTLAIAAQMPAIMMTATSTYSVARATQGGRRSSILRASL